MDEAWRGRGIGDELVRRLLERLAAVETVFLRCGEDLVPYYERQGFGRRVKPEIWITRRRSSGRAACDPVVPGARPTRYSTRSKKTRKCPSGEIPVWKPPRPFALLTRTAIDSMGRRVSQKAPPDGVVGPLSRTAVV